MKVVVAKKEHTCALCGRPIPKGHRYWSDYQDGGGSGVSSNRKEHTNCAEYDRVETARESVK